MNKPKQKKALWYRAKFGDAPKEKKRKPVRRVSKAKAARDRVYNPMIREWKKDRLCACAGVVIWHADHPDLNKNKGSNFTIVCSMHEHLCSDNHHTRGKLKELLMDERFRLPVCRKAHNFIRDNPAISRENGWLPPLGQWNKMPK